MTEVDSNQELIDTLKQNETHMTDLIIAIKTICKQYPPAKNENMVFSAKNQFRF